VGLQHLPMRKRGWITGMVVSIAVGLCGLAVFAACRPFLLSLYQPAKPCVTPAWEQPMLTAFRGDPIWKAAPPTFVADAPVTGYGGFSRYCDLVGEHRPQYQVNIAGHYRATSPVLLADLRTIFGPTALGSGWAAIAEGDMENTGCGLPYDGWNGCGDTGLRYCRTVAGVVSYLEIMVQPVQPPGQTIPIHIGLVMSSHDELSSCPGPRPARLSPTPFITPS
jgi:hypothetical protein